MKVDAARLSRAMRIKVFKVDENGKPLPTSHYRTESPNGNTHYCRTGAIWDCDCEDWAWSTETVCKHLLKALIVEQNPVILGVLDMFGARFEDYNTVETPDK